MKGWILEGSGPVLSHPQLAQIEQETGRELPETYRQFLLSHNGGFPVPDVAYLDGGGPISILLFHKLLDSPTEGVRRAGAELAPLQDNRMLPIAINVHNEHLCLGGDCAVYVSVWEYDDSGVPVATHAERIANSFDDFLAGLVVLEKPTDRIIEIATVGAAGDLRKFLCDGFSVEIRSGNGHTIIEEASKAGNIAMIRACAGAGADFRESPHLAVQNNQIEALATIAALGCDLELALKQANAVANFRLVRARRRAHSGSG